VSLNGGAWTGTTAAQPIYRRQLPVPRRRHDAAATAHHRCHPVTIDTADPAAGTLALSGSPTPAVPTRRRSPRTTRLDLSLSGRSPGTTIAYQVSSTAAPGPATTAAQAALIDGSYQFRAVVSDAGNSATTRAIAVTIDTADPGAGTLAFCRARRHRQPDTRGDAGQHVRSQPLRPGARHDRRLEVSLTAAPDRHHCGAGALIDGSYQFRAVVTDAAATAPPPVPSRYDRHCRSGRRHAGLCRARDTGSPDTPP